MGLGGGGGVGSERAAKGAHGEWRRLVEGEKKRRV